MRKLVKREQVICLVNGRVGVNISGSSDLRKYTIILNAFKKISSSSGSFKIFFLSELIVIVGNVY